MNALKVFIDTCKRSPRDSYIFKSYTSYFYVLYFASYLKCLLQPHLSFSSYLPKLIFFKCAIEVSILGLDTLCMACLKGILSFFLCIYVFISVYLCVYIYVYIHICIYVCLTWTRMYIHICMLTHVHLNRGVVFSVASLKYAINTINDGSVYFHFLSVTFQTASNILLQFKSPLLAFYCHRIVLIWFLFSIPEGMLNILFALFRALLVIEKCT